jgi:hypothetical protein
VDQSDGGLGGAGCAGEQVARMGTETAEGRVLVDVPCAVGERVLVKVVVVVVVLEGSRTGGLRVALRAFTARW